MSQDQFWEDFEEELNIFKEMGNGGNWAAASIFEYPQRAEGMRERFAS